MLKKFRQVFRYIGSFHITTLAGSTSFFILLSLIPLLTLILTLLRYLPLTLQDLLSALSGFLPAALMGTAKQLLNDLYTSNAAAVISVTAVLSLWSASRGVFGILNGVSSILGSQENRGYLRRRLTAIVYTFLMIIALFLTLGLQVFGTSILEMIAKRSLKVFQAVSQIMQLRFLFTAGILALFFMMIYAYFPARRMHLKNVVPGAILSAVGWLVFSYLFSIYVDHGGGSRLYGSIAIILLSFLWLYSCMCILFFGAIICRLSADGKLNRESFRAFFRKSPKKKQTKGGQEG